MTRAPSLQVAKPLNESQALVIPSQMSLSSLSAMEGDLLISLVEYHAKHAIAWIALEQEGMLRNGMTSTQAGRTWFRIKGKLLQEEVKAGSPKKAKREGDAPLKSESASAAGRSPRKRRPELLLSDTEDVVATPAS